MKRTVKSEPNPSGHVTPKDATRERSHDQGDFFRDPKKDESDSQWEHFKDTLKRIATVPKEEVDEMRAEYEREKKKRATQG